jgi:hypothetical protein
MIRGARPLRTCFPAIACLALIAFAPIPNAALAQPVSPICSPGNADSFVSALRVLTFSYDPKRNGANYKPPFGNSAPFDAAANPSITDDLKNAFNNAPPFFQAHLCGLNGIYISPAQCANRDAYNCTSSPTGTVFNGGWGFRSRSRKDLGSTYISISAALWPNGGHAWPLDAYETQILQSFPGGSNSSVTGSNPNTNWMTILAALAHELGHVRWATATVQSNVGGGYYFDTLRNCRIDPKTTDFFYAWDYGSSQQLAAANRWRDFNNRASAAGGMTIDHFVPPTLDQLDGSSPNEALFQLYQADRPWASLFGAQTPDEDFVETYVMYVLTGYQPNVDPRRDRFNGPLTSMPLAIPGFTGPNIAAWADVPRDLLSFSKPTLQAKMRCIPI